MNHTRKIEARDKQGFRWIMIAIIFVWAGMLLGISFLEAPLKFQAPNVTLAIGLGIGRLVFGTLNKIEVVFAITIAGLCWKVKPTVLTKILLAVIAIVLLVQTISLLPILDKRAGEIIAGGTPSRKSPHVYYVIGEVSKLVLLIFSGFKLFKSANKPLCG